MNLNFEVGGWQFAFGVQGSAAKPSGKTKSPGSAAATERMAKARVPGYIMEGWSLKRCVYPHAWGGCGHVGRVYKKTEEPPSMWRLEGISFVPSKLPPH
jgi:hypothetical protein